MILDPNTIAHTFRYINMQKRQMYMDRGERVDMYFTFWRHRDTRTLPEAYQMPINQSAFYLLFLLSIINKFKKKKKIIKLLLSDQNLNF